MENDWEDKNAAPASSAGAILHQGTAEGRGLIGRAFEAIVSAMNAIGSFWILVIMALLNVDVLGRFIFNTPVKGVPLLVSMSIIAIVFLQISDALRNGKLTRNGVVIGGLQESNPKLASALLALFHLGGALLMALIIYFTWGFFVDDWVEGTYYGSRGDITLPEWPLKLLVIIGSTFCLLQFLSLSFENLQEHARSAGGLMSRQLLATMGFAVFLGFAAYLDPFQEVDDIWLGFVSVLFVLVFIYLGVHVGVALGVTSVVCIWLLRDNFAISGKLLSLAAGESLRRYEYGAIPLFVLMGFLVSHSGIGKDTYDVANHLFRRVKGGLGTATVFANAVFAAVTGTSIASASVFTRVAVPEMIRLGYHKRFAVGVVAGSSVLGMLIPPSLLLILFGILSETSISALFLAGIVPGIVLALAYSGLISFMAHKYPARVFATAASANLQANDMSTAEAIRKISPIVLLICLVLGGIYGGVFTATEAGGVGALGALILTIARRRLDLGSLRSILVDTGHVTAALSFLLVCAHVYARMIALSGIPDAMDGLISTVGLGYLGLILVYLCIIIVLGTVLDAGSILLIMVPMIVPIVSGMEMQGIETYGLVWLGIVTIIAVEIGLLTPPLGLACFVIHSNLKNPDISLNDVFWGAIPFAIMMLMVLALMVVFPGIPLLFQ